MSTGSKKDWHYQEKTGKKKDFEEGGGVYKQMEWSKDCVMHALSKVLGVSTGDLAKRIVDERIGGVNRIDEMENGSVIKRVLEGLDFTPLVQGGCTWATARHRMRGINGRLYGVWWYNRKTEDWTDKPIQIGRSDHAFSIWCNDSDIVVPTTNWKDFDTGHPTDDEWVSVFEPPTLIRCEKKTVLSPNSRDRRFNYG